MVRPFLTDACRTRLEPSRELFAFVPLPQQRSERRQRDCGDDDHAAAATRQGHHEGAAAFRPLQARASSSASESPPNGQRPYLREDHFSGGADQDQNHQSDDLLGLIGHEADWRERLTLAFFGICGVGSFSCVWPMARTICRPRGADRPWVTALSDVQLPPHQLDRAVFVGKARPQLSGRAKSEPSLLSAGGSSSRLRALPLLR